MLTAFLILVAIASRLTGSRNTAMRFGILATISAGSIIAWIAFIAPDTISYFSPTVLGLVQGLNAAHEERLLGRAADVDIALQQHGRRDARPPGHLRC